MAYQEWKKSLDDLIERLDTHVGMWEGVTGRCWLREQERGSWLVHYLYVQLLFDRILDDEFIVQIADPRIVEMNLTIPTWRDWLVSWAEGESFRVGDYTLIRPTIDQLDDIWAHNLVQHWNRLLVPIDIGKQRISPQGWIAHGDGNSESRLNEVFYEASRDHGFDRPEQFANTYLGRPMNDMTRPSFYTVWPWGAWLSAETLETSGNIELRIRPPLNFTEFWLRYSSGSWSVQLSKWSWPAPEPDGLWILSRHPLEISDGPTRITAWAGREEKPELLTILDFRPITPEVQRERVLTMLYQRSIGGSGKRRTPFMAAIAPGAETPAADFELAVTNVLGVLGYSVLASGVQVQAAGVDAIAFQRDGARALVVSITLGNDVGKKLVSLLGQREWMSEALSFWNLKWVIVSGKRREDITKSAQTDCNEGSVVLVCRAELELLASEPPDFAAFRSMTGL